MRRRRPQSALDQTLVRYGVTPSGGRVGVLKHLTPEQFAEFRAIQRIGTKDPKSRAKFERRISRVEARMNHEHSFFHGMRFNDPEYHDWYAKPGNERSDALDQIESQSIDYVNRYLQNGLPLSVALSSVAEDWKSFRNKKSIAYSAVFDKHFSSEDIDHVMNHVATDTTVGLLRKAKLGK